MAEKQVSIRIKADGAQQVRQEFSSLGRDARTAFAGIADSSRLAGGGLLNVGYQVQDFAVQVAGGTSVSRALAQQLPQLLSGFGLIGVAAGTAVAILAPFITRLFNASEEIASLNDRMSALSRATSDYEAAAKAAAQPTEDLQAKYGKLGDEVKRTLDLQRDFERRAAIIKLAGASGAVTSSLIDSFGGGLGSPEAIRAVTQGYDALIARRDDLVRKNETTFASGLDPLIEQANRSIVELDRVSGAVDRLAAAYDISRASALDLATAAADAFKAMNDPDVPVRARLEAVISLRDELAVAAGQSAAANTATAEWIKNLNDVVLAAAAIAASDIATPVSSAADQADRLASNMDGAVARFNALARAQAGLKEGAGAGRGGDPRLYGMPDYSVSAGKAEAFLKSWKPLKAADGNAGAGMNDDTAKVKALFDSTRTSAEKYAAGLAEVNRLQAEGDIDADLYARAVARLGKEFGQLDNAAQQSARAIRGAFMNLFDDPAKALADLARQLAQMAVFQALGRGFPSIFGAGGLVPLANSSGNAFSDGKIVPFASGGVVTRPTLFPMAKGTGLMGEAGPEAILPLARVGGKLGVRTEGGGGVNVQVINLTGTPARTETSRGPDGRETLRVIVGEEIGRGSFDKANGARYGVRPVPVPR